MGLNFRKSMKIAPGVRLNISKKGLGVSAGVKGARISQSATGRTTVSTGIPGSGISYRKTVRTRANSKNYNYLNSHEQHPDQINNLEMPPVQVEHEIILEPRYPRKFWTGFWVLSAIGSIGADFGETTPGGPSRLSSILFSLIPIGITIFRIYRHKNPKMNQVVRIKESTN